VKLSFFSFSFLWRYSPIRA